MAPRRKGNNMATDDERQAYIDEMARKRGYVLNYHKVMAKADYETLTSTNQLIEQVYLNQRSLDRRTKELIFIATLTAMRAGKGQIQSHIRAALDLGLTPQEILEAIEITLPEAGVVVFQAGFEAWREIVGAEGIEPTVKVFEGGSGAS
jgi:4-carboxymuconolactone decarboxylase